MSYVLRCLGLASRGEMDLDGPPRYVARFDVDFTPSFGIDVHSTQPHMQGVTGICDFTPNLADALHFPTQEAAFVAWRTQSTRQPLRPDGKPNRPLTAYSMTVEPVP